MENFTKTELLAPAGNYEKMLTAFHFGADAVYLGGKNFSLRTFANNFTAEEMQKAVQFAHSIGKKVYITVNIFAKNADFGELEDYLLFLQTIRADAVLISDPGVIYLSRKIAPSLLVHLSTQANTTNRYSVKFWQELGVKRVVLARELSLKEIAEIRDFVPDMELEAFVHGAMCISYSGRCLLSDYMDGRSSNRGACVQACRWQYEIRQVSPNQSEDFYGIEQDGKGSYILNSKDLCMIRHLDEMKQSGIFSFKIEGRMKSCYYLATVINAYRRALDNGFLPDLERELSRVSHRDYTTAYMLKDNKDTVNYVDSQAKGDSLYIADVLESREGQIFVKMKNRFRKGDCLQALSSDANFGKSFTVDRFYDSNGTLCDDGKLVEEIYAIDCPYSLKRGDILRREEK